MNEDQNEQRAEKFRLLYRFLKVCQKGSPPVREHSRPHLSERPFRTQPGGNLRKFPRGLGQFPLSFPPESRWGPAPSMKLLRSLAAGLAGREEARSLNERNGSDTGAIPEAVNERAWRDY